MSELEIELENKSGIAPETTLETEEKKEPPKKPLNAQELKEQIAQAREKAAHRKEEEQQREEKDNQAIKEYRKLIKEKNVAEAKLQEKKSGILLTPEIIETHFTGLEPRFKALEAMTVENELSTTEEDLKKFNQSILEELIEPKAKQELIEQIGIDEYNKLLHTSQESQQDFTNSLDALKKTHHEWEEEIKKIVEPIQEHLKISNEKPPQNQKDVEAFLKLVGEKLQSHHKLSEETEELSAKLSELDEKIQEIINQPQINEKLLSVLEHQEKSLKEFLGAVDFKMRTTQGLLNSQLDMDLAHNLASEFFTLQTEKYGLNDPDMPIAERKKRLDELKENISRSFRDAEKEFNLLEFLDSKNVNDFKNERWKQSCETIFLFKLLSNPEYAPLIFEIEFNKIEKSGSRYDEAEKKEVTKKRLQPYLPLLNIIKAVRDAQDHLRLANEKLFAADTRNLNNIVINTGSYGKIYGVNFDHSGAFTAKTENGKPTPEDIEEKQESIEIYQKTYKEYLDKIAKFRDEKIDEAKQTVEREEIEMQVLERELEKSQAKKAKVDEKIQLFFAIDIRGKTSFSEKFRNLISERNQAENKLKGVLGSIFGTNRKKLEEINADIQNWLAKVYDLDNSSKAMVGKIIIPTNVRTVEDLENDYSKHINSVLENRNKLTSEAHVLEKSIKELEKQLQDKKGELMSAKSNGWYRLNGEKQ